MYTLFVFTILVCFLAKYLFQKFQLWRKLPPGPLGIPIIGYIPFISRSPHFVFTKLAKKYGNVFRIRLGNYNAVILNDFESTKEAFAKDAFMGRPPDFVLEFSKEALETEAFMGLPWKEHRRFSLHMLRDLGLGKSKLEGFIQEEIIELLEHLKENVDKPFKVYDLLSASMSNIISSLVFGKRLQYDDPARHMTVRTIKETTTSASQTAWMQFFPRLKQFMTFLGFGHSKKLEAIQKDLKDYIMLEVKEHEKTFDPNNIRDFIDGYLIEIKKRKDPSFCNAVVQDLTFLFFAAGSETVRTTVEWLLLFTAAHQDFQQRIQQEIDETVGRDQSISWVNHTSMPFTEAYINEVMRLKTILPLNLLRYTLADGELSGYFIPKGSYLICNLWAIHHDPDYWGQDADEFRPQRFLTDDGKALKKLEHMMPFSIGKRACPGEPLAKVEVFMYFTSILQKLNVTLPEGKTADFEGVFGGTLLPKPQDLIYTVRN